MIKENERFPVSGLLMLPVLLLLLGLCVFSLVKMIQSIQQADVLVFVLHGFAIVFVSILLGGFFVVHPNQGVVLQLFGKYVGTARVPGLRWSNPFYSKRKVSLRVRNFETGHLKVNDSNGNPVEIAAVVVWRVVDTAEAVFEVDDYEEYVHVQSEAALRNLATAYPYDSYEAAETSLRGHTSMVASHLKKEIQERLTKAEVEVIESRISHLAYAPEIAAAMLQRQQAAAIIAARQKIVEGAVGMVEMALDQLSGKEIVRLDEVSKASMVSNLLVVLCSDRATQPIVNTGA